MWETIRIVKKLNPKYILWENVKNVLSVKHRHNFDKYIDVLKKLGYNSYYEVLNAKDYGVPQNRERVFTVSIREDIDNKFFEFPEKQELKLKLKDMLEENVNEKYYLSEKMMRYVSNNNEKWTGNNDKSLINKNIASAINTGEGHRRCDASNYVSDELSENTDIKEVVRKYGIFDSENAKHQAGSVYDQNGLSPTLDTMQGGWRQPCIEDTFVGKKYSEFIEKNGYIPEMFNPYNESEIKDIAPTQSTYCGSTTSSSTVLIKNATKKGYLEAKEGDGINISSRMKHQRGNVQKEMAQTLTTNGGNDRGVVVKNKDVRVVGNYMPSGHEASRIIDSEGVAPTVKENHGTVTAIMEENNRSAKHQQDLLQHKENLCRCIPAGTHGSTPHLLKTIVDEQPLRIRKLTPKECWRLMGFDDEDFEKAEKVNSNTQLYKQAGNSIVVNVLEKIFSELFFNKNKNEKNEGETNER